MKNLVIGVIVLFALDAVAQDGKARTEAFSIDFTAKKGIQIDWLYPQESDSITSTVDITVKIGYNVDAKIKDLSLLLNSLPISTDHRGDGFIMRYHPDYQEYIEQPIKLSEGVNKLKFVLRDENGNVEMLERTLTVVKEVDLAMTNRRDYAVLFATDEYDEWGDLVNPIEDAKAIAKELDEIYGFQVEVVENPTQDEMIIKLREYTQKKYLQHDQLLIFIAGHGHFDDMFGQGYLVTKDSKKVDPSYSSYISHDKLRTIVDNIPTQHTLMAIDACFGGTFDPLIARAGSRGGLDLYNGISTNEFLKRKLRYKTRKYVTSGGKTYVSDGLPGRHSPFASKILEGLRSYGGNDKIITTQELYLFLDRLEPEPKAGNFGSNEPGSDFVFLVKDQ